MLCILFVGVVTSFYEKQNAAPLINTHGLTEEDVIPNQWIIHLKESVDVDGHKTFLDKLTEDLETHQTFKVLHHYDLSSWTGYSIHLKDDRFKNEVMKSLHTSKSTKKNILHRLGMHPFLQKIRQHPDVFAISPDHLVSIADSIASTQETNLWNLQRICQRNLPTNPFYVYDNKGGSGVNIYSLDTGVMTSHSDFNGRASFGTNNLTILGTFNNYL